MPALAAADHRAQEVNTSCSNMTMQQWCAQLVAFRSSSGDGSSGACLRLPQIPFGVFWFPGHLIFCLFM